MSDEMQRALGRIEGKLDALIDDQRDLKAGVQDWRDTKNKGYGILAAVAVAGGSFGAWAKSAVVALFHGGQP